VKAESTRSKNQIQSLLRRNGIRKPEEVEKPWTKGFMKWLASVELSPGSKATLSSYIMQFEALEKNVKLLNEAVEQLSQEKRYVTQVEALVAITGVGILTAMVFLTELGDLGRFPNRRAFIAYIGMAPSSHESGDVTDRKGHITRCGSSRIRGILNQAVWARLRHDVEEKAKYEKYLETHKGGKKKAIVTFMSKLALTMWHTGLPAQYEYERRVA
jgi:transposase